MGYNESNCPCKRTKCERHGNCTACKEHHIAKKNSPTYCEKLTEKEERRALRVERKCRK